MKPDVIQNVIPGAAANGVETLALGWRATVSATAVTIAFPDGYWDSAAVQQCGVERVVTTLSEVITHALVKQVNGRA